MEVLLLLLLIWLAFAPRERGADVTNIYLEDSDGSESLHPYGFTSESSDQ